MKQYVAKVCSMYLFKRKVWFTQTNQMTFNNRQNVHRLRERKQERETNKHKRTIENSIVCSFYVSRAQWKTRFWKMLWFKQLRKIETHFDFLLLAVTFRACAPTYVLCTCVCLYCQINLFIDVFQARTHEQTHSITVCHNQRQYEKEKKVFFSLQSTNNEPNHCQWQQLNSNH